MVFETKRRVNIKRALRVCKSSGEVLEFEEAKSFMYLGILIHNIYDEEVEINLKIDATGVEEDVNIRLQALIVKKKSI